MKMKPPVRLLLLLAIAGLSYFQPRLAQASFICDTPPACQCGCLDQWDECAGDLPIDDAREKCDPAYNKCYDEKCTPM